MNVHRGRRVKRFEQMALPHLPALYRGAWQMVGEHAAEDLVQETYLRAWKYFDTFDPNTNCRLWLFRIMRNVWVDRCCRPRLEIPLTEKEESVVEPYYDWEADFLVMELSHEMEQALAELPAEYRWAVLLADVEEFSYRQIAETMSCPIGTVMSRINRGRRMLARLLRAYAKKQPDEKEKVPDNFQEKP